MSSIRSSSSQSKEIYPFLEERPEGVDILVRVQPRGSKNCIGGIKDGRLAVKLTSPPVEGEANKALIRFLSKLTGHARSDISISSGERSRSKRVSINGASLRKLDALFTDLL